MLKWFHMMAVDKDVFLGLRDESMPQKPRCDERKQLGLANATPLVTILMASCTLL